MTFSRIYPAEGIYMLKSKAHRAIFNRLIALLMVYGMETYHNIVTGSSHIFVISPINFAGLVLVYILFQKLIIERIARKIAFKVVTPSEKNPFKVLIAVQISAICLMCPMMSLVAAAISKAHVDISFLHKWLATVATDLPMAIFLQLLVAGPIVRWIVTKMP
jgi:hypothetical protein